MVALLWLGAWYIYSDCYFWIDRQLSAHREILLCKRCNPYPHINVLPSHITVDKVLIVYIGAPFAPIPQHHLFNICSHRQAFRTMEAFC